jgi:DNA-directed RNA polymerase subunit M/transcription elongation factor TFIIS
MHFCDVCGRAMSRDTSSGRVKFRCPCSNTVDGTAKDARISGAVLGAGQTTEMYRLLIQTAPYDRTNQLVARTCPECGLDYMTQIRVGDAEIIIYKCKCGFEEKGGAGPRATNSDAITETSPEQGREREDSSRETLVK